MQTCLERIGIDKRPVELNRNDYQSYNEYNAQHVNALSDGDMKGKGTGHGGHTHYLPDCNKAVMTDYGHFNSPINYSNFDTSNGGGLHDIKGRDHISFSGRERLMGINIYNGEREYGRELVNTELNIADGQIVIK